MTSGKMILGIGTLGITLLCCCLGCVCPCGVTAWYGTPGNLYGNTLPKSARNIQEYGNSIIYWEHYLKAEMPKTDFLAYMQKLSLAPCSTCKDLEYRPWYGLGFDNAPDWFDVTNDTENAYRHRNSHDSVIAKYENGFLYLFSVAT